MKRYSTLLLLFSILTTGAAQTILQPGIPASGNPIRQPHFFSGAPSQTLELMTVDNYNINATQIYSGSVDQVGVLLYEDTLQIAERVDTLGNYELRQHAYQYSFVAGSGMLILGGLSHRTVNPIEPVLLCVDGNSFYAPWYGWYDQDYYHINWQFAPADISYPRFDPRYLSYSRSAHPWGQGVRITAAYNRKTGGVNYLDIYDIYPEQSHMPTGKLFSIPLESTFYLNHSIDTDRNLLLSGLSVLPTGDYTMKAKAMLVDLENESWIEIELPNEPNTNSEVVSGHVDENGVAFLLVRILNMQGELLEIKLMKFDGVLTAIKTFAGDFEPISIVERTTHGVLLGGDYNRFGLKTASLFEVEEHVGLSRMIGYADIKDVATSFKHFEETDLGGMIAGTYDSLNGSPKGSFMTPLVQGSLLSVDQEMSSMDLGTLMGTELRLFETGVLVEVLDVSGRICYQEKTSDERLQLSFLNTGVYLLRLSAENKEQVIKTAFVTH